MFLLRGGNKSRCYARAFSRRGIEGGIAGGDEAHGAASVFGAHRLRQITGCLDRGKRASSPTQRPFQSKRRNHSAPPGYRRHGLEQEDKRTNQGTMKTTEAEGLFFSSCPRRSDSTALLAEYNHSILFRNPIQSAVFPGERFLHPKQARFDLHFSTPTLYSTPIL
jgi:hypothetical protein